MAVKGIINLLRGDNHGSFRKWQQWRRYDYHVKMSKIVRFGSQELHFHVNPPEHLFQVSGSHSFLVCLRIKIDP